MDRIFVKLYHLVNNVTGFSMMDAVPNNKAWKMDNLVRVLGAQCTVGWGENKVWIVHSDLSHSTDLIYNIIWLPRHLVSSKCTWSSGVPRRLIIEIVINASHIWYAEHVLDLVSPLSSSRGHFSPYILIICISVTNIVSAMAGMWCN